jgi:hypothetical protein
MTGNPLPFDFVLEPEHMEAIEALHDGTRVLHDPLVFTGTSWRFAVVAARARADLAGLRSRRARRHRPRGSRRPYVRIRT